MIENHSSTASLVDLYEITMLQAALHSGMANQRTTFELFARRLPNGRRYGAVGGTGRAVEAVRNFRFTDEQLRYLSNNPVIDSETVSFLENYKFNGRISGYREGDVWFPNSPILTVEGSFAEAVLIETVLLSVMNHDSAVMSAASRMVVAAQGMPLIEMGSRRTHEISAVSAARAAYIAGFAKTSNVEAGIRYGVPTTGTSAHAFTLAFGDEKEAFAAQVEALGVDTTLLVDTYDIEQGIRNAVEIAGPNLGGIRIDSGDLHEETVNARKLLDSLGATNTKIVLSSDIDEYTIAELLDRGTPVDAVGAGTRVVTGSGHPTAGMVYKLVERENSSGEMIPVAKNASGKKSVGGFKEIYRTFDNAGKISGEFAKVGESDPNHTFGTGSIQQVFIDGDEYNIPTVEESRKHHVETLQKLPEEAKMVSAGKAIFELEYV